MVITSDIDVCNLMRFKEHSFTVYTVCHTTCVYIPVGAKILYVYAKIICLIFCISMCCLS